MEINDLVQPSAPALAPADLAALTARVRGPVLLPGDDGYDAERSGFQLAGRHRPAVIVGARCAEDVVAAVRFARDPRACRSRCRPPGTGCPRPPRAGC